MSDNRDYRRDMRGRFTKMSTANLVPENVSATDVRPGMEVPRHAPMADELAQGDAYPPGVRRGVLIDPRDQSYFNGLLRTAARDSGPMDPTPFLTGLDGPETPAGGQESSVSVYGDGGRTMSPRRAEDVAPGRGRRRSDGR